MGRRNGPGARERAVEIGRGAGVPTHPVIDQCVAGSGIKGEDFLRPSDPRHIRNAADVEDGDRLRQGRGEGCMVQRSERRSLSACRYVGRAEIGDYVQSEPACQQRAVTDLPCASFGRAMPNRVTVKSDYVDRYSRVLAQEKLDGIAMKRGQLRFDRGNRANAAEDRPKPLAKIRRIRECQRRPRDYPVTTVSLDNCDVDAVERG